MKEISYKKALEELTAIKNRIQNDEIDLDELANQVKRARELVQFCQAKLRKTEEVLKELLEKEG